MTLKLTGYAMADLFRQAIGLSPLYVPATAKPGGFAVATGPGLYDGICELHKLAEDPDL